MRNIRVVEIWQRDDDACGKSKRNTAELVMLNATLKQRGAWGIRRAASAVAVGAMLLGNCASALGGELPITQSALEKNAPARNRAELEKTFWMCDHAATKGMVDVNQAAVCSAIMDELRREKFDGDFEKLLAWWKLKRSVEHQKLDLAHIG